MTSVLSQALKNSTGNLLLALCFAFQNRYSIFFYFFFYPKSYTVWKTCITLNLSRLEIPKMYKHSELNVGTHVSWQLVKGYLTDLFKDFRSVILLSTHGHLVPWPSPVSCFVSPNGHRGYLKTCQMIQATDLGPLLMYGV